MRTSPYGAWFAPLTPRPDAEVRLVCLPYAGGGATIYRGWSEILPAEVEVVPVQLPGREWRLKERPLRRMEDVVAALSTEIEPLTDRPFALFGHSMGALIGFELTRALRRRGGAMPQHLFVSGHSAPQRGDLRRDRPYHAAPDDEFVAMLRAMNGTPPGVLDHPELLELILPALRADFELCERYVCEPDAPLDVPVTALAGIADPLVPPDAVEPWRQQTTAAFSLRVLPGGHFFLNESRDLVLRIVVNALFAR
nr:thioesterase [uncultured bacterium]